MSGCRLSGASRSYRDESAAEHNAIRLAIRAEDGEAAAEATRAHCEQSPSCAVLQASSLLKNGVDGDRDEELRAP